MMMRLTRPGGAPDNGGIGTQSQSEFRSRSSEPAAPGKSSAGTGRLVLIWYAGLIVAALFMHWAMAATDSMPLAAALAAAAVAIPLSLLGYTMRAYRAAFNSHILVPAIGPIVIAVLIFEYVEYNKRVDDAYSAQLIPTDLVLLSDVKWARNAAGGASRLSGHVVNRSPHQLVGMSLEVALYGGSEKLGTALADAPLNVAPGQQANFSTPAPDFSAANARELPCVRQDDLPPSARKNQMGVVQCVYRVAGTRGEQVFF